MRGKRQAKRARKLTLVIVAGALLLFSLLCLLQLHSLTHTLQTQTAADRWRGESEQRFAQISVFLPADAAATQENVYQFRQLLPQAFIDASIEEQGGNPSVDAYSGSLPVTVFSERASAQVRALGVGGDYFLFHPLALRSGSYISDADFMKDRVVLDEELAWTLFGSTDIVGQYVYIGQTPCPVAGVVHREDDFASSAAYPGGAGLYVSYDLLAAQDKVPICCYETVLPDPVKSFAKNLVTEKFQPTGGVIVENSQRWSLGSLLTVIGDFGKRSMNTKGVVFPYWENAARLREDYAGLCLLLTVLSALLPLGLAVYTVVFWIRRWFFRLRKDVTKEIERAVEEEKEKNYVAGGI